MSGTHAIVQARMGSSRLPGKVLLPLGEKPVLGWVIERLRRAAALDGIQVATSTLAGDDAIANWCRAQGVPCFRGSETDVLARYAAAAQHCGADRIVRITADCPLTDPALLDAMLARFDRERPDYLSNVLERTYPKGLDIEICTIAALMRAQREAQDAYEREHVTPYFYRHPKRFRLCGVTQANDLSGHRWCLDTPEDYAFLTGLFGQLGPRTAHAGMDEILGAISPTT